MTLAQNPATAEVQLRNQLFTAFSALGFGGCFEQPVFTFFAFLRVVLRTQP